MSSFFPVLYCRIDSHAIFGKKSAAIDASTWPKHQRKGTMRVDVKYYEWSYTLQMNAMHVSDEMKARSIQLLRKCTLSIVYSTFLSLE